MNADERDVQDRAERHSIAQFLGVDADILARIDALPIPETDWRSIAEAGAAQLADLVAAVEIMDQKIVPLSERDDGTVSQFGIGDSTWHRVLAVARGHVSEKARRAIDAAFAASPSLQAGPAAVRPAPREAIDKVRELRQRLFDADDAPESSVWTLDQVLRIFDETERVGVRFGATITEWHDDGRVTFLPGGDFREYPAVGEHVTIVRNVGPLRAAVRPATEDEHDYPLIDAWRAYTMRFADPNDSVRHSETSIRDAFAAGWDARAAVRPVEREGAVEAARSLLESEGFTVEPPDIGTAQ